MPPVFGFSVGDFIAGIGLLIKSYHAVRCVGGVKDEYQRNIEWLEQLGATLQKLSDEGGDDVPQLSEGCKKPLNDFKVKIRAKYDKYLGTASQAGKVTVAMNSIRWTFAKDASKDLVILRNAIGPQLTLIDINLSLQQRRSNLRIEDTLNDLTAETRLASDNSTAKLDTIITSVEHVKSDTAALSTSSATLQSSTNRITMQLDQLQMTLASTKLSSETHEKRLSDFCLGASARSDGLFDSLSQIHTGVDSRLATIQSNLESMRFDSLASRNVIQEAANTISERDQYLEAALKPWIRDCVKKSTTALIGQIIANTNAGTQNLSEDTGTREPILPPQETPRKARSPQACPNVYWSQSWFIGFGTLTITVKQPKRRTSQVVLYDIEFRPISCFNANFRRALAIFCYKSGYVLPRIELQPRAYSVVPKDAPIFQACRKLDIEMIKDLFKSGTASPFDLDSKSVNLASCVTVAGLRKMYVSYISIIYTTETESEENTRLTEWREHWTGKLTACVNILELLSDCGLDCGETALYDYDGQLKTALEFLVEILLRSEFLRRSGQLESILLRICRVLCERSRTQPFNSLPAFRLLRPEWSNSLTSYIVKGQRHWPLDLGENSVELFRTSDTVDGGFQELVSALSCLNERLKEGHMYWLDDEASLRSVLEYQNIILKSAFRVNPDLIIVLHDKFLTLWLNFANPSIEHLRIVSLYAKGRNLLPHWERLLRQNGYTRDMDSIRWKWTRKISRRERYLTSFPKMPGSFPEDEETLHTIQT